MNVLSLFDGMSCGQLALKKAGVKIQNYYASEIDKFAIQVTQSNFPKTIQLGDVTNIDLKDKKIDLLIGGSPCQGFSIAGKRLNFEDERSRLFFEYLKIKNKLKPKYFLLENVIMDKEIENQISKLLGVNPVRINTNSFLPINRDRLYWTNIPIKFKPKFNDIRTKILKEDETHGTIGASNNRVIRETKFFCALTASMFKGVRAAGRPLIVKKKDLNTHIDFLVKGLEYRMLTPIECELLQGVPVNYTSKVSNTQRYKMLGNGWTVDVVAHIFKGLK